MNWLKLVEKFASSLCSIKGSVLDGEMTLAEAFTDILNVQKSIAEAVNANSTDDMAVLRLAQVEIDSRLLENSLRNCRLAYVS